MWKPRSAAKPLAFTDLERLEKHYKALASPDTLHGRAAALLAQQYGAQLHARRLAHGKSIHDAYLRSLGAR